MLLRRAAFARELDEEMRLHREMRERELVASGVHADEARYAAARAFGNATALSERGREAWGWRWLEDFLKDLRFAARMLRKNPGFTLVSVVTLALGIGANTAMFGIVNAWLLRPLPLHKPQELASVWRTRAEAPRQPAYFNLYHDYLVWSSRNTKFQSLGATFEETYVLTGAGEPEQIHGAVASWNFFETVGQTAELGRTFVAQDAQGEPACVISHGLWLRAFHSAPDIAGRIIQLNRKRYRVLGVLPASFSFRVLDRPFETEAWTLLTRDNASYDATSPLPVAVIGRLRNGASAAQGEAELAALQGQLDHDFTDEPKNSGVLVVNLQQDNTRNLRSSLLLLFGAVAVLLIIACVNTGSLILGRNAHRAKEFAVRVALGCNSRRLLQQLSVEVLTIFAIGGLTGLAIALGLLRGFEAWNPFGVLPPGGFSLDVRVLAVTTMVICGAALLFGSLPALRVLRARSEEALRGSSTRSTAPQEQVRWRNLFVAMEISLSVILLVGAGLLISTFVKIDSEPPGFRMRDVLAVDVSLPNATYRTTAEATRFCEHLLRNLRATPGVRAAGAALSWPFNVDGLTPLETDRKQGLPMEQLPRAATFQVSPGYFDALGIPLLRGRMFDDHDQPGSLPVTVISDQMARTYFAGEEPIGKRIRLRYVDQPTPAEPWLTIVGMVGSTRSVRYNQIAWDKYPAVYTSFFQRPANAPRGPNADNETVFLYVQGGPPLGASMIAAAVHRIDPDLPLGRVRTTEEIVGALRSQPRVRALLLAGFGGLTLLLAAIGVGGVMGQMVEQRRRDIGVRMALGAMASDIRRMVLRQTLKLAVCGIAAGLLGAAAVARLLRGFLFGMSALDPVTFAAVIVLLCLVALAAGLVPAMRAASINPIETLRME
jgi:predicted permease